MSNKFKTFDEMKEEFGNKFEEMLYKSNIELLEKIENLIKYLENQIENEQKVQKFLYENKNTKLVDKAKVNGKINVYRDILEKVRNGKYE